jgi:hypothetical protein
MIHASETSTLSEADQRALGHSESKILRSSYEAVQDKGSGEEVVKVEIHTLYDEPNLDK